ncbi:MAG: hypothetical protein ACO32I_04800 [Candidatus Limnocylindrus sp.]
MNVYSFGAFCTEVAKLASLRETLLGGAEETARRTGRAAAEGVAEAAKAHGEEIGRNMGRGIAEHAPQVGRSMGQGLAEHAPQVGQSIGRGMGEHLSDVGGKALTSAVDKLKEYGRSPYVRGAGATLGTLYVGSKVYGAHKQRERDKRMERMTAALEAMANKRD